MDAAPEIEHHEVRLTATLDIQVFRQTVSLEPVSSYPLWPKWVQPSKVRAIKELPIFAEVHDMILNGYPDAEVVRAIHGASLHLDEEFSTIQGWVSHYRATVPKALILVRKMPKAAIEAHRRVQESLDMIAEADKLYRMQLRRAEKAIKREDSIDYIIPGGEKEILAASTLLDKCAKMRKEIGLTDKQMADAMNPSNQLERFDLDRVYSREGINEKLRDPVARLKILNAVEKMVDLVSRRVEENPEPIKIDSVTPIETNISTERKETPSLEVLSEIDLTTLGTPNQLIAGDEP